MELVDRFNTDFWVTCDNKPKGFVTYTMVRPQFVSPGKFKYAIREVRDDEADAKMDTVTLDGACGKMDPLASIRNCELLVRDSAVFGVCIDDEIVTRKDLN